MSHTSYNIAFSGLSTLPTASAFYKLLETSACHVWGTVTVPGTSNQSVYGHFKFLLPFRAARAAYTQIYYSSFVIDNSANRTATGRITIYPGTNVAIVNLDFGATAVWTASGTKSVNFNFVYQINDATEVFEANDGVGARPAIICAGQSNLGTGVTSVASDLESGYKTFYPNIRFSKYASYPALGYLTTVEVAGMDYSKNETYQTPDQNGTYSLQFYLLPQVQALAARKLYVSWHGIGNTGLVDSWKASAPVGTQYSDMVFKVKALSNRAKDIDGVALDYKFFLWVQGEYDSRVLAYANAYETNLTNFINGFRAHTGIAGLPFVIMKLNTEFITAPVNPGTYAATVNTAIDNVAGALADVYTVSPEGATMHTDKIHYTPAGELELANRIMTVINANSLMS